MQIRGELLDRFIAELQALPAGTPLQVIYDRVMATQQGGTL